MDQPFFNFKDKEVICYRFASKQTKAQGVLHPVKGLAKGLTQFVPV